MDNKGLTIAMFNSHLDATYFTVQQKESICAMKSITTDKRLIQKLYMCILKCATISELLPFTKMTCKPHKAYFEKLQIKN